MQVHFLNRHVLNTVVILEEGNFPHPLCARCDMQGPQRALNGRHLGTAQCLKEAERKRQRLAEVETRENSERAFEVYGAFLRSPLFWKGHPVTLGPPPRGRCGYFLRLPAALPCLVIR